MNGLFSGHELVEAKHAGEIETHGRVEAIIDRAFRVNSTIWKGRAARRLHPAQAIRPKICCTKDRCASMSPLDTVRTCPLASIAIAGPVAKFFHARFASELRSAEPAEYQPWIAF